MEIKKNSRGLLIPNQDVVFQALFGTRGSEEILGGLLTNILGEKVENVSLEANQNLIREIPTEKLGIVDLRANVGNDTTVHIEVQMVNPYNMFKRILWYWARIYGTQLKNKEDYSKLKKTISILIANYDIKELTSFKDAHTIWNLLEKRNLKITAFNDIEIHIIELPKIRKYQNETEKRLGTWLEFLSNPESEEVKMSKEKDKELKQAYEKLEYISDDDEFRRLAELRRIVAILDENSKREGERQHEEEWKKKMQKIDKENEKLDKRLEELEEQEKELAKQGEELAKQGEELAKQEEKLAKQEKELNSKKNELILREKKMKLNGKIEIVKKMKDKKISVEEIMDITGLTKDEIEQI